MATFRVACSTITWGSERPRREVDPLAEIAAAGYEGAPCGMGGGSSPAEVKARYSAYGLAPAPGYLGAAFWEAEQQDAIVEQAQELAGFMAAVGCTELFVASQGFDAMTASGRTRRQAAAQVRPEEMLSADAFKQFAETLSAVGRATQAEGVKSCFHNHVGTFIETREEIDTLFGLVDHDVVFQGPDIGHLAWAGADPVAFCHDYGEEIRSVHLKDIDPAVLARGLADGWDYGQFSEAGIFAELGEGMVDLPAVLDVLRRADYQGWIIIETDRTMKATAYESAVISRQYLKRLGL